MDLKSGFWQVGCDPQDADKTAFIKREGQFRLKVLSYGSADSPVVFQRSTSMIFVGSAWHTCLVYIDDANVVGRTFDEHIVNAAQVFQQVHEVGLKLKAGKCKFLITQVRFLGHVVLNEDIAPDPVQVSCRPVLKNMRNLRSLQALLLTNKTLWNISI